MKLVQHNTSAPYQYVKGSLFNPHQKHSMQIQYSLDHGPAIWRQVSPTLCYLEHGLSSNEKLRHISRTSLEKAQLASSPSTPKGLRPLQVQSFQKQARWCSFRGPAKRCNTGLSTLVYFERSNPSHYCLWKRTLTTGGTPCAVDNTTTHSDRFLAHFDCRNRNVRNKDETMLRHSWASTVLLKCSKPVRPRHSCFHLTITVHENESRGYIWSANVAM